MAEDTLIQFDALEAVLQDYARDVVALYKQNLIQSDHLATEHLLNDMHFEIAKGEFMIAVDLYLQKYWAYVEMGTKPHFPPLDAIRDWIRVRNIVPRPYQGIRHTKTKGDVPYTQRVTENQLAYLIGRKIAEEGTEGSWDLSNALEQVNRDYEERIADAITKDVQDRIDVYLRYALDINR